MHPGLPQWRQRPQPDLNYSSIDRIVVSAQHKDETPLCGINSAMVQIKYAMVVLAPVSV